MLFLDAVDPTQDVATVVATGIPFIAVIAVLLVAAWIFTKIKKKYNGD